MYTISVVVGAAREESGEMKRQLKVLEVLDGLCFEKLNITMLSQYKPLGFTAEELAGVTGFSRSNVSSDLNGLHREGFVVKLVSKSTYYITVKWVEKIFPSLASRVPEIVRHQRELEELAIAYSGSSGVKTDSRQDKRLTDTKASAHLPDDFLESQDPFAGLIGADKSLKTAVEQAKASVLYPPRGLDTLLVGPTGVGKTLFAEYMYKFACSQGKIRSDGYFIEFNCADYAHNPQLLMSQLFGHVKGAFTGADKDKIGLVEKADGGMLFLDEVHRLPPEGQEMLFYLLDRGDFRRMGDSDKTRHVTVRVVAATTENPDSTLLQTFLRRIPVIVQLPELSARPLEERFEMIKFLLSQEARHIQSQVTIGQEVLWSLLLYRCIGNIGQLRNDLQLVCAKAFLQRTDKEKPVEITYEALSPKLKQAIVYDPQIQLEANHILCTLGSALLIYPDGMVVEIEDDRNLSKDFYHFDEQHDKEERRVGVLVIAHGNSTASSMVEFCNKFIGIGHAKAVDMPIETHIDLVIEEAVEVSKEIDEGKGVLLLVDMGLLSSVAEEVTHRTGITVKSVDMVSTLMLVHVLYKAVLPENDIDVVYRAAWAARSM